MTAPISLIVSAFAPVTDARRTLTPLLRFDGGETVLVQIDLGGDKRELGASALAQVYGQLGNDAPDLDDPQRLAAFSISCKSCTLRARYSPIVAATRSGSVLLPNSTEKSRDRDRPRPGGLARAPGGGRRVHLTGGADRRRDAWAYVRYDSFRRCSRCSRALSRW